MTRFAKKQTCPSSQALADLAANNLPPHARRAAERHLRSCDFCAAEVRLLARDAAPDATTTSDEAPPVPLALRLFAESRLAEINSSASPVRRAA